jgi:hypothetical protein
LELTAIFAATDKTAKAKRANQTSLKSDIKNNL